jgi:hypothetical protein
MRIVALTLCLIAMAARGPDAIVVPFERAPSVESLTESLCAIQGVVPGIGFDGIPATGARVAIAATVEGLSQFGTGVAGLYGHNWLTGTDYLIDYAAQQLPLNRRIGRRDGAFTVPLRGYD